MSSCEQGFLSFFNLSAKDLYCSPTTISGQGVFAALVLMEYLYLWQKYSWTLSDLEKMYSEFKFHTIAAFLWHLRI